MAARHRRLRMMRTVVEPVNQHAGSGKPVAQGGVHAVDQRLVEVASRDAGLVGDDAQLVPGPAEQPRHPREFLETVCLGAHLDRLPDELREPYLNSVLEVIPRPLTLDYVRLNISARRP